MENNLRFQVLGRSSACSQSPTHIEASKHAGSRLEWNWFKTLSSIEKVCSKKPRMKNEKKRSTLVWRVGYVIIDE
jgi:hypothetical protein